MKIPITTLFLLLGPLILMGCQQTETSEKAKAYHENSEIIGEERDEVIGEVSKSIYESIDRKNTDAEPVVLEAFPKEGAEVQLPEGRYTISGQTAGTVTIYDEEGAVLYEAVMGEEQLAITLDLLDSHTVHVDGFEAAYIEPTETALSHELGAGIWEVGKDIEPGKFEAHNSFGYGYLQLFTEGEPPQVYEFHGEGIGQDPIELELVEGQKMKITEVRIHFEPQS